MAFAQDLVVTGTDTIAIDSTYDNVLIEDGGTLVVDAVLSVLGNMTISSGGTVTHTLANEEGLRLSVVGTLLIEDAGAIEVSAKGLHGGNSGSQFGSDGEAYDENDTIVRGATASNYGVGGSFGGTGARGYPGYTGVTNPPYGLVERAMLLGAGGSGSSYSGSRGGHGGGLVRIEAGELQVDGTIDANGQVGQSSNGSGGGGSGGSIRIEVGTLSGGGHIHARGGLGLTNNFGPSGAGGGGRIALLYDLSSFPEDSLSACGGSTEPSLNANYYGSAGTIYLEDITGNHVRVIYDNANRATSLQSTLRTALSGFDGLTLRSASHLKMQGGDVASISIVEPLSIPAGTSLLLSDGATLAITNASGFDVSVVDGATLTIDSGCSLAMDALQVAGATLTTGVDLDFSGGSMLAMSGASRLRLLEGVRLTLDDFTPANVQGGIVECLDGSVLDIADGEMVVGDGVTVIKDGTFGDDDELQSLTISSGGTVTHTLANEEGLRLSVVGTLLIEDAGAIEVSAKGLHGGNSGSQYGPDGEAYDENDTIVRGATASNYGVGGSFGGTGARGYPGYTGVTNPPYGLVERATLLGAGGSGSSASGSRGGHGGGLVRIEAGELQVNGTIDANGQVGQSSNGSGGGGSGGSIRIEVGTLSGGGHIHARGGLGLTNNFGPSGAGGGGRIALLYDLSSFPEDSLSACGGSTEPSLNANYYGSAGTIYLEDLTESDARTIVDNDGRSSNYSTVLRSGASTFFGIDIAAPVRLDFMQPYTQPEGALRLLGGSVSSIYPLALSFTGSLEGWGTLETNVENAGLVSPGSSPGVLTIEGDLTCDPVGTTEFELNGEVPGVEHDQIIVTGLVELDGILSITLGDDLQPAHGQSFEIMRYGQLKGRFAEVSYPDLSTYDPNLEWYALYGPDALRLYIYNPVIIQDDGLGDYPTIQDAIDGEDVLAIIELTPGTFTGEGNRDIVFDDDPVVIRAQSADPDSTVIDCEDASRAFTISGPGETMVVLSGFKITGGNAEEGGAILCTDGATPLLQGLVFDNNRASSGGGGLHLSFESAPQVDGCVFRNNSSSSGGGGLHLSFDAEPEIRGCEFRQNNSTSGGGGLHLAGARAVIDGCTISTNQSSSGGGGLHLAGNTILDLSACTIAFNSVSDPTIGSGLHLVESTTLTADHCIVAFNGVGPAVVCDETSEATLVCCDVYDNSGGDWIGCLEGQLGIDGNIAADPLFCDGGAGDFTLSSASPCAADNNPGCGLIGALDVGCEPTAYVVTPDGDLTIQDAVDQMADGDVLMLAHGIYLGPGNRDVLLPPLNIRIQAQVTGQDSSQVLGPGLCIIDCQGSPSDPHRAFILPDSRGLGPELRGLQIRNGYADEDGGAILCGTGSRLRLDRCILTDCEAARGGAIAMESGVLQVHRCTFYGNVSGDGSALNCGPGVDLRLTRTIITAGEGVAVVGDLSLAPPPSCCDIWGNAGGDWVGILEGFGLDGDPLGNINLNPLVQPDLNFILRDDSPCGSDWNAACGTIGAMPTQGEIIIGVEDESDDEIPLPLRVALLPARPNPFNPSTLILFDLPTAQRAEISIYDVRGHRVVCLHSGELSAGRHGVVWHGRDAAGRESASGVYFCRLQTREKAIVQKMVLLK